MGTDSVGGGGPGFDEQPEETVDDDAAAGGSPLGSSPQRDEGDTQAETFFSNVLDATVTYRPDAPASPRGSEEARPCVDLDHFVRRLVRLGTMDEKEVGRFLAQYPEERRPREKEHFARELIKARRLTPYQAAAILQGKTKGLVIGNYLILDRLGAGGMGLVFRAEHRRMKRTVALKVLFPSLTRDTHAVQRFMREAKVVARLSHPNIVAALDADEFHGLHYFVMEYAEGNDLSRVVKKEGPLSVARALDYVIQAARGLQAAHAQSILHRDIKPSNLILDTKGAVKLLDLGLARLGEEHHFSDLDESEAPLTRYGALLGTVDYMAPEQAIDPRLADHRSDVYSLGCTLYYLLTGRPPYRAKTLIACLIAHREHPIPSVREGRPDVPPELDGAITRMLAKDPDERHPSLDELLPELEACLRRTSPGWERETTSPGEPSQALGGEQVGPSKDHPSTEGPQSRPGRLAIPGALVVALAGSLLAFAWRPWTEWRWSNPRPGGELPAIGKATSAGRRSAGATADSRPSGQPAAGPSTIEPSAPAPPKSRESTAHDAVPPPETRPKAEIPAEAVGLVRALKGHERDLVESVALSSDGRSALSGGDDGTVRLWDVGRGSEIRSFRHEGPVNAVAFSRDDRRALSGSSDRTARIWDVANGQELCVFRGHSQPVYCAALSPEGPTALTGGHDKFARLWDVTTGAEILKLEHLETVMAVAFTSDGRRAVTASGDTIRLWDLSTGQELHRLRERDEIWCLSLSADGDHALSGGMGGTLTYWSLYEERAIRRFDGPGSWVRCAALLPDGRHAISGDLDGNLALWDLEAGRSVYRFSGVARGQLGIAVAADGLHFLTASDTKLLQYWRLPALAP